MPFTSGSGAAPPEDRRDGAATAGTGAGVGRGPDVDAPFELADGGVPERPEVRSRPTATRMTTTSTPKSTRVVGKGVGPLSAATVSTAPMFERRMPAGAD